MMAGEQLIGQKDVVVVRSPDRDVVLGERNGLKRTVGRTDG